MRKRIAAILVAGALGASGLAACDSADDPGPPGRDESMLQPEPQMSGASKATNPYPSGEEGRPGAPGTAP